MKITKEELKNLINEEIEKILESEEEIDEGLRDVLAGIRGGAGKVGSDVSAYAGAVKKAGMGAYTASKLKSELAAIHKTVKNAVAQLADLQTKARGLGLDYDLSPALKNLNNSLNPIAQTFQSITASPTARLNPSAGEESAPEPTAKLTDKEMGRSAGIPMGRPAGVATTKKPFGRPEGEETVRMAEEE